jgi:hypothetical protein
MQRDVQSPLSRFALPHQFAPQLTLYGAVIAVTAALTQILMGSLIAALWGVGIWETAASAHSAFWKFFVIPGDVIGLAGSLGAMFYVVHLAVVRLDKKIAGGPSVASPAK